VIEMEESMTGFVNSGSGPVEDATEDNAIANIAAFASDVAAAHKLERIAETRKPSADDGDGRYTFTIELRDASTGRSHSFEVQMPGLPLDEVNYGARSGDSAWEFPRLYVDGSSWLWQFAIEACKPPEE
jgi:hypothetical protein